ncbi:MAG: hypothetical protein II215_03715 [Paludibacteraceae bacterium]|nr:hypothetical protein [Paludibacteraceae bacterium]
MERIKQIAIIVCLLLHSVCTWASFQVGEWKSYLSFQGASQLLVTPNKVYAIAEQHLCALDKDSKALQILTKIDGLSQNNVQAMAYCPQNDVLLLVYSNANIDLVNSNGTIYNIPDLLDKNWAVDKTVYQIYIEQDKAYLACGFGILVVDLTKREIKETYIIGVDAKKEPIYGITANNTHIFALSTSAIYKAEKTANLLDFNVWQIDPISLPVGLQSKQLFTLNNQLFTIENQTKIWQYKDNAWQVFFEGDQNTVSWTQNNQGIYITGGTKGIFHYTPQLEQVAHYDYYALMACVEDSKVWLVAGGNAVACSTSPTQLDVYTINSMPNAPIKELQMQNGVLTVAPGGYWTDRYRYYCQIPMMLQNEQWVNYTEQSMHALLFTDYVLDVTSVAINPNHPDQFYFTTWGEGLFQVTNGVVSQVFNETNSNGFFVSAIPGNDHYVRLDGLTYDDKGNLWLLNTYSGIKVLDTENNWHQLPYQPLLDCSSLRHLLFTKSLNWCVNVRSKPGVFVFANNKTLTDMSDDKYRFFGGSDFIDKDGKTVLVDNVYDVAEGTDGTVWVGTNVGPILFNNLSKVFDASYRCTRIKIPRNDGTNLADYLLDGVAVQAIEVDAGNRKWIGTASAGAYLLSPDGKTTIHHFTAQNSPLTSNNIVDIAIDHQTGIVYFGTPEGLFAYRSDAMQEEDKATQETIYAFPNPVRPDFDGVITIAGLEENSTVWITDASANVVFQGQTSGGSISWNGRNASNQKVAGGVYFVLVSNGNSNNHRSVATKILIVR